MEFDRILNYTAALALNNERPWFHAHHKEYEQAWADFLDLLEYLRFALIREIPELETDLLCVPAKSWTYRVARDARMHRDAPPYNPAFRAYLSPDRHCWMPQGYFIRVFPGDCYIGTGLWCEDRATVNGVRAYIRDNWMELQQLLGEAGLEMTGHQAVKTAPRGYDPGHPAIQWLRMDGWMVKEALPDSALTDFRSYADRLASIARRMEPTRKFLLRAAHFAQAEKGNFR